jgi:hypothetical protein
MNFKAQPVQIRASGTNRTPLLPRMDDSKRTLGIGMQLIRDNRRSLHYAPAELR